MIKLKYIYCPNFRTNELKVWTVLSTDDIVYTSSSIVSSFVPSAITQPFFELQTPDFAWKFVWTVPTNYEKKNLASEDSRRPCLHQCSVFG